MKQTKGNIVWKEILINKIESKTKRKNTYSKEIMRFIFFLPTWNMCPNKQKYLQKLLKTHLTIIMLKKLERK